MLKLNKGKIHLLASLLAVALLALVAAGSAQAEFSIVQFDGAVSNQDGSAATQAGSHPFSATTSFLFPLAPDTSGAQRPDGQMKDVIVDLPAGFVGNPTAITRCTEPQFIKNNDGSGCPIDSQVGYVGLPSALGITLHTP